MARPSVLESRAFAVAFLVLFCAVFAAAWRLSTEAARFYQKLVF
ncbi:hypothetical protein [Alcaligenes phenolicus]